MSFVTLAGGPGPELTQQFGVYGGLGVGGKFLLLQRYDWLSW